MQSSADGSQVFVELLAEADGDVLLYMRRKRVPSELDGGLVFYCVAHHSEAELQDGLFERVARDTSSLKALSVNADTFHHTGKIHTGFATVKHAIAKVKLPRIAANTHYQIAIVFKLFGSDRTRIMEDSPPLVETIQLRQLKDQPQTRIVALTKLVGMTPWRKNLLPSLNAVQQVAHLYYGFLVRATHRKRIPLSTPIVVRGVSDPLCSSLISMAMLCGDILRAHGGVRDEVPAGRLFDALSDLGWTPQTKSVQTGPLQIDWHDFLILASFSSQLFPRLHQLVGTYRSTEMEGITVIGKVKAMLSPEKLPAGSLIHLFIDEQRHANPASTLLQAQREKKNDKAYQKRRKKKGSTASDEKEEEEDYRTTTDDVFSLTPGRAVWSACARRQQARVLLYVYSGQPTKLTKALTMSAMASRNSIRWESSAKKTDLILMKFRFFTWTNYRLKKIGQREANQIRRMRSMALARSVIASVADAEQYHLRQRFLGWITHLRTKKALLLLDLNSTAMRKRFFQLWWNWSLPEYRLRRVVIPVPPPPPASVIRVQTPGMEALVLWRTGELAGRVQLPPVPPRGNYKKHPVLHQQGQQHSKPRKQPAARPLSQLSWKTDEERNQLPPLDREEAPKKQSRGRGRRTPQQRSTPTPAPTQQPLLQAMVSRESAQNYYRQLTFTLLQVNQYRRISKAYRQWKTFNAIMKETARRRRLIEDVLSNLLLGGLRLHCFRTWKLFAARRVPSILTLEDFAGSSITSITEFDGVPEEGRSPKANSRSPKARSTKAKTRSSRPGLRSPKAKRASAARRQSRQKQGSVSVSDTVTRTSVSGSCGTLTVDEASTASPPSMKTSTRLPTPSPKSRSGAHLPPLLEPSSVYEADEEYS